MGAVDHISGEPRDPRHRRGLGSSATTTSTARVRNGRGSGSPRSRQALPRIERRCGAARPAAGARRMPILIGGGGVKRTIKLVARHADIWHAFGRVDVFREKSAILDEHCATKGATRPRSSARGRSGRWATIRTGCARPGDAPDRRADRERLGLRPRGVARARRLARRALSRPAALNATLPSQGPTDGSTRPPVIRRPRNRPRILIAVADCSRTTATNDPIGRDPRARDRSGADLRRELADHPRRRAERRDLRGELRSFRPPPAIRSRSGALAGASSVAPVVSRPRDPAAGAAARTASTGLVTASSPIHATRAQAGPPRGSANDGLAALAQCDRLRRGAPAAARAPLHRHRRAVGDAGQRQRGDERIARVHPAGRRPAGRVHPDHRLAPARPRRRASATERTPPDLPVVRARCSSGRFGARRERRRRNGPGIQAAGVSATG